jgi:hypothetical protein
MDDPVKLPDKQIFAGLCFYLNGSTAPLVSDHKLKHMLAAHGARHSIALGRRSVTHVLLGTANAHGGAGGGLAATKIQKEIASCRGKAVKFITAEWYAKSSPSSTSAVATVQRSLTHAGSLSLSKPTAACRNRALPQ